LDPPPGELAEPITLRDKLACVWKQLLAEKRKVDSSILSLTTTRSSRFSEDLVHVWALGDLRIRV